MAKKRKSAKKKPTVIPTHKSAKHAAMTLKKYATHHAKEGSKTAAKHIKKGAHSAYSWISHVIKNMKKKK